MAAKKKGKKSPKKEMDLGGDSKMTKNAFGFAMQDPMKVVKKPPKVKLGGI